MGKRNMSENSLKNLKPNTFNNCEIAKKAQEKSVEKRAERKKLKEYLELALSMQDTETGEDNAMTITKALITQARKGNVQAYQTIRDTVGEKPTDKQEVVANVKADYKLDTKVFKKALNDIDNLANE